jgi:hypothetical protein
MLTFIKTTLYPLIVLSAIFLNSCTPNNPQPNPSPNPNAIMHTVKLETSGSSQYSILYKNETESICTNADYNGNWSYQFQTEGNLWLQVQVNKSQNSPLGLYECKIYIDGVLWKFASGNVSAVIQAYYAP